MQLFLFSFGFFISSVILFFSEVIFLNTGYTIIVFIGAALTMFFAIVRQANNILKK